MIPAETIRDLTDRELNALSLQLLQKQTATTRKTEDAGKFSEYQEDPLGFVREVLGDNLWSGQEEILLSVRDNTYTAVRSCHNSGKTRAASRAALWFLQSFPGSCVITTAPSGRQVRDLLWREVRAGFENSKVPLLGRCMTTMLDIAPDWYATGFATDEPVNFQGPHSPSGVLFIGDEASGLAEWVIEAARGFMTQNNARMLLIGNPNFPSGSFYDAFQSNRWNTIHIQAKDVPPHILRPDWKEEMIEDYGADSIICQVRVFGNFPVQAENSLFDMNWIEAAFNRALPEEEPIEIGADISRYGDNESCAYVRKGKRVVDCRNWQGKDTMKSAGIVAGLCRKWWPTRVKVDEIGVGTGVLDRLKEEGWPVIGVNSNSAPKDKENFFNLRSELYSHLAQRFRNGEIALKQDRKLLGQLLSLTYEHTPKGTRKIIGKDELKKAGKKSPDRADALMLCFAERIGGYAAHAITGPPRRETAPSAFPQAGRRPQAPALRSSFPGARGPLAAAGRDRFPRRRL